MICKPCRDQDHDVCFSTDRGLIAMVHGERMQLVQAGVDDRPPTGLSPEGTAAQRAALCSCQHKIGANRV